MQATPEQQAKYGHISTAVRKLLKDNKWRMVDLLKQLGHPEKGTRPYAWLNCRGAPNPRDAQKLAKLSGHAAKYFSARVAATSAGGNSNALVPYKPKPVALRAANDESNGNGKSILQFTPTKSGFRVTLDITLSASELLKLIASAQALQTSSHAGDP